MWITFFWLEEGNSYCNWLHVKKQCRLGNCPALSLLPTPAMSNWCSLAFFGQRKRGLPGSSVLQVPHFPAPEEDKPGWPPSYGGIVRNPNKRLMRCCFWPFLFWKHFLSVQVSLLFGHMRDQPSRWGRSLRTPRVSAGNSLFGLNFFWTVLLSKLCPTTPHFSWLSKCWRFNSECGCVWR